MRQGGSTTAGLPSPAGARSWRFYAFSEPCRKGLHPTTTGLFHPANAHELPPSGPCSSRRSGLVSEASPPVPLSDALSRHLGSEGLIPPGVGRAEPKPDDPSPLDVLPSEALPPAAVASASRDLLSRASSEARAEAHEPDGHHRVSPNGGPGCAPTSRKKRTVPAPMGFVTSSRPEVRRPRSAFR